ncbi:MAG: tRNA (cytidine(34)-2'-O)-methyltransferase [Thermochromatium sp.]
MFDIILYEPEIPPNTGNVMRLTANLGARLHLIEPLGFSLDDRLLRRAGLDYREWAEVQVHGSLADCLVGLGCPRLLAVSTRGHLSYVDLAFCPGDAVLFGPETRGLPEWVLESVPPGHRLYIPMRPGNRSLNLSNAVAVVLYEAWRQQGFAGAAKGP